MAKLTLIREQSLTAPFCDQKKLEASGVAVKGETCWVIFDNLTSVAEITLQEDGFGICRLHEPGKHAGIEGFEAISCHAAGETLYVAVEGVKIGKKYYPKIAELEKNLKPKPFKLLNVPFMGESKGFEGIAVITRPSDEAVLLFGLCEGNFCEQNKERGKKKGNGRLHVFMRDKREWRNLKILLPIPPAADFRDYSDIAMRIANDGRSARVAITSQEGKSVWIGHIDLDRLGFIDDGEVLPFPGDDYCNVEGVDWISDNTLVLVSDKAKSDSPNGCKKKEMSIHLMRIE
ncbi:MAG: hypothetical protein HQL96_00170 [Magnetococcales bacterium]|nr:hypothetical protein [Magnetococcales bacterium]